ncbi:AraC family transcriptional regulator [Halpernia sp. GG3]
MNVSFERITPDKKSSFRTLHNTAPIKDFKWEYHFHPEIELVCIPAGNGTRHVGYHKSNYTDGDLVLIGSNIPHSGFGLNSSDPHEEIVLQFKQEILQFPAEETDTNNIKFLLKQSQFGLQFTGKTKREIIPKLREILDTEGYKRYLLLLEILFYLSKSKEFTILNKQITPYKIIAKNKIRLQNIFTFVEKNYHKEIDINEVANLANLTLPAFCNFFKKTTEITFTDFVNRFRITKACLFLSQGMTASEVCFACGFNSVSYFSRMFKKYTSKKPSDYSKQL